MQRKIQYLLLITIVIEPCLSFLRPFPFIKPIPQFPNNQPNRFRGPPVNMRPLPPRFPMRPHSNIQRPFSHPTFQGPPPRPHRFPNFPPMGQLNRPPGQNFPNFQQMGHLNRPPGQNFQQYQQPVTTATPIQLTTNSTNLTTISTTTTTTTTTRHPLDSVEDVNTILDSMEEDGSLNESGWKKHKVKPMLKDMWPYYKNVKSMLLEREKAKMALMNLKNRYHARRQRLRNLFHLRPYKMGVV